MAVEQMSEFLSAVDPSPEYCVQRSTSELHLCGLEKSCQAVKEAFSAGGACEFEALQVLYSQ